ncbi:MAG: FAD/NAD(P)-binding protein [Bacteriovorax sp.]|jgi:uncharacterized NAD(P)/FAD-binding protein YdhS
MKTIAIIGGGFSGTMTAVQLMKQAKTPLQIYLIDKENIGRGLAYAENDSCLLLNVRADQMGAFPENVSHFYEWLQAKNIECAPTGFISRSLYGDYLSELLHNAIKESAQWVNVEIINDEVVDIEVSEIKKILFANHHSVDINELVLATGALSHSELKLADIKKNDGSLTIIGTGLSMVDAVIYLNSINFQGKMTAVSRRGKIPEAHQFYDASVARPVYDFTSDHSLMTVLQTVKENLKKFEWRLVIDGLRPHSQSLWSKWSTHERGQFLRFLRPLWDISRHRMAPRHKKIIEMLINSNRLEIKRIGFSSYKPTTKIVLNCTGVTPVDNTLIQKLIKKNLLEADFFRLGVLSQFAWIHTIGHLLRGELWECTAVPEIRVQAKRLATELLKE